MISVLYVEDETSLLEIGKFFLEKDGSMVVDTCSSVNDALTKISAKRYDIIISDYAMPVMNGIEFLKSLRSRGDTTPFIIFTGRGRESVVIEALNLGADFYLVKAGNAKVQYAELMHEIKHI
ncbi:MAG TPA: response regulator, partial [Methanoregula sp.]|nr:response regulator [Methanoregula sp.]